jgi:hypothetical protein
MSKGFAPRSTFLAMVTLQTLRRTVTHMATATFPPSPAQLRLPPVLQTCQTTTCGSANTPGSPRLLSLSPSRTSRDSVEEFKVPTTASSEPQDWNFGWELAGAEQLLCKESERSSLLMMLVTGLGETTFPTSLCAASTPARDTSFPRRS